MTFFTSGKNYLSRMFRGYMADKWNVGINSCLALSDSHSQSHIFSIGRHWKYTLHFGKTKIEGNMTALLQVYTTQRWQLQRIVPLLVIACIFKIYSCISSCVLRWISVNTPGSTLVSSFAPFTEKKVHKFQVSKNFSCFLFASAILCIFWTNILLTVWDCHKE